MHLGSSCFPLDLISVFSITAVFTQAQVWLHHKYTEQWKGGAIIFARRPFSFDISVRMANVTLLVAGSGLQVV